MYATSKVGMLPLKRVRIIECVRKTLGKIQHHSSELRSYEIDESGVSVGHVTGTANLVPRRVTICTGILVYSYNISYTRTVALGSYVQKKAAHKNFRGKLVLTGAFAGFSMKSSRSSSDFIIVAAGL